MPQQDQYPPGSVGRYAVERGWIKPPEPPSDSDQPDQPDQPDQTEPEPERQPQPEQPGAAERNGPATGPAMLAPGGDSPMSPARTNGKQRGAARPVEPVPSRPPTAMPSIPADRLDSAGQAHPSAPIDAPPDPTVAAAAEQRRPPAQPPGPPPGRGMAPPQPFGPAAQAHLEEPTTHPELDLSSARLLKPVKRVPQSGWRRLIYVVSGRLINPGESPNDTRRRELTHRLQRPLTGCYKIAMLSLKGGVGKTTITATLGATFASLRGDRVVAVDANPDRGTLSQKIPLETTATVRHLLRDAARVRRYTDVRAYTSQGLSRLEVLASEQDPAVSEAFSEDDYRRTVNLLEHFYNIVLTDCGTGLMHSAMYGVLGVADQLVIVSSASIDGARSASATMDWLDAHGHGELVKSSVAVINSVRRTSGGVDLDRVAEHFAARCRAVIRVPFDGHLDEGAEIDLDRLSPSTRIALLELAANVADIF